MDIQKAQRKSLLKSSVVLPHACSTENPIITPQKLTQGIRNSSVIPKINLKAESHNSENSSQTSGRNQFSSSSSSADNVGMFDEKLALPSVQNASLEVKQGGKTPITQPK